MNTRADGAETRHECFQLKTGSKQHKARFSQSRSRANALLNILLNVLLSVWLNVWWRTCSRNLMLISFLSFLSPHRICLSNIGHYSPEPEVAPSGLATFEYSSVYKLSAGPFEQLRQVVGELRIFEFI